jgi:hypothetical protein
MEETGFAEARKEDVEESMAGWGHLTKSLKARYGLDMEALKESYREENQDYAYRQAWQGAVAAHATVGEPQELLDVNMHTVTKADLFGWNRQVNIPEASLSSAVHLLCGWFDVRFCAPVAPDGGSKEDPVCVELSTSPTAPYTHWAHTTMVLDPPLRSPRLDVSLEHSKRSHHDLNVTLGYADLGLPEEAEEVTASANGVGVGEAPGGDVVASYAITAEFRTSDRSPQDARGDGGDGMDAAAAGYAYDD